jgi:hypothetical protein
MKSTLLIAGFITGIFAYVELIRWVYTLSVVWEEYRTAVAFPHLQRRANLWPIPLIFLLHSGPWFLAVIIFGTYEILTGQTQPEWYWYLGGFYGYGVIIGTIIALSLRRHSYKSPSETRH